MVIKEIANTIEEYKGKTLILEYCGTGVCFGKSDTIKYEIQEDSANKNNASLKIWDSFGEEFVHIYEDWFKLPSKKEFEKRVSNIHENRCICHYWNLIKSTENNLPDILIIDALTYDNYRKALDLQAKYKID